MQDYGVEESAADAYVRRLETSKTEVAPGLALPDAGHVWALDKFAGEPQLIQLKYTLVNVNNNAASNMLKTNLAPFIYKPKVTLELPGPAAVVRLHDATPAIFLVGVYKDEDAAEPRSQFANLALVRVKVRGDKRVVSAIAFTQVTGNAKRSQEIIETSVEKFGANGWFKLMPKQPLEPGEYALVRLPEQDRMFGASIFDFAVDPSAPQDSNAVRAGSAKKE